MREADLSCILTGRADEKAESGAAACWAALLGPRDVRPGDTFKGMASAMRAALGLGDLSDELYLLLRSVRHNMEQQTFPS
eukprot:scaffold16457_cov35-Prasinocladus_malaysianus.AAC.1